LLRPPHRARDRYWDLLRGAEVRNPIEGSLPPRGVGAYLAGPSDQLGGGFDQFLMRQRKTWSEASNDSQPVVLRTRLVKVRRTRPYGTPPPGMVEVPAADVVLKVQFRNRECGFYESRHPLVRGDGRLVRHHQPVVIERRVKLRRYAIDETPVTNAEFARFLDQTHYRPRYAKNFLRHWRDGRPPADKPDHPVVWVDLDDCRAYAEWAGKRLPTEEEWQRAAQGPGNRRYPWGDEIRPGTCNGGETGGTTPVRAFPAGRSPYGCYDLCGNTWEWTESERSDGHTRFAILRGGAYYKAKGSMWYTDGGPQPCGFAMKYLLMWPGLDRCATIGFRCVADL